MTSQHLDDHAAAVRDDHAADSRHTQLRAATSASHTALDRYVGQQGYFTSLANYKHYVCRMHAFERGFAVAAAGIRDDWLEKWQIAQRAQWLKDDMFALGGFAATVQSSGESVASPVFASPSELLGGLYVVIGSGLGARVLATRSAAIGLPETGGNDYLTGLGETTRWGAFVRFLEAEQDIDDEQMCAGALATFAAVFKNLSEPVIR